MSDYKVGHRKPPKHSRFKKGVSANPKGRRKRKPLLAAGDIVNNVLNALYYDYAIASSFTAGRFSAYPLPGRTYMVKAGATF